MLEWCKEFTLFVLCLSPECYEELQKLDLPRINLISLEEVENWDSGPARGKKKQVPYGILFYLHSIIAPIYF